MIDMGDAGIGFGDHGDLRYCINHANANAEPSNLIKFHRRLTGTIVLTQGPLDISKDLTIRGPLDGGITISGNHRSGVFDITADPGVQAVTLSDLTIADGTGVTVNGRRVGGGLYNDHATVTLEHVVVTGNTVAAGGLGGGIANATGAMILNASTVSGNSVASNGAGGGIENMSGTLTLNSSTVSGNSVGGSQGGDGGGISSGAGLVVLNSSLVTDNDVPATASGTFGGGLFLEGPATITDSTISGNNTGGFGGGIDISEPFPSNILVSVTRSAIVGNHAMFDGGLINSYGNVTIDHTVVSGNSGAGNRNSSGLNNASITSRMTITDSLIADNTGGSAILNEGQMTLSGSTIADNSTPYEGGGLNVQYGAVTAVNCTFSGNTAGTSGGGIALIADAQFGGLGLLDLTSVTITANKALGVDAPFFGGGGVRAPSTAHGTAQVVVHNTLIAGNSSASLGTDVYGYVVSMGYNLVGVVEDGRGWAATDSLGHYFAPLNPLLGPLQDNGGPTPTHAVLAGSPAIETGDPRLFGSLDQRGTVRLHNGLNPPVDIGAFDSGVRHGFRIVAPAEVVAGEPFTVTVIPVDAFGFKVTTFTETIHFSSTDGDAVLPADYTFTPQDAGMASFSVTLQTPGSQQLVVTDVDIPIRASTTITVDPPAEPGRPPAGFADMAFAEYDPVGGWLPGRKHARTN